MVRKKSWREKLTNSKDLPRVEIITATLSAKGELCVRGEVVAVQVPDHLIPR